MKLLLSPSKTKKIAGRPESNPFRPDLTEAIVGRMRVLTVSELMKVLKIKVDAAERLAAFYADYDAQPVGAAIESYSGLVFKRLDWETLTVGAQAFGRKHLAILSALYGVAEPMSPVKAYRLDLVDRIGEPGLLSVWREAVEAYTADEDWILNLASKEYAVLIRHPKTVTIEFYEHKNGKLVQGSTSSKEMRGLFARYVLEHEVAEVKHLPTGLNGFELCSPLPEALTESICIRYIR